VHDAQTSVAAKEDTTSCCQSRSPDAPRKQGSELEICKWRISKKAGGEADAPKAEVSRKKENQT